jgi:hypothetical protein
MILYTRTHVYQMLRVTDKLNAAHLHAAKYGDNALVVVEESDRQLPRDRVTKHTHDARTCGVNVFNAVK